MTLEDLRIFVSAAEAGSMGELARSLGRTQPAIAHHVRRLEQEFGTPLLERTRRGVTLTEAGRAVYDRAAAALAALRTAEAEVAQLRGDSDGALSLAASSGMVRHALKPTIVALRRKRPEVDFRLVCSNTIEEQLDAVRRRRADLAFVALSQEVPGFQVRGRLDMPYSLLVQRDDPLARRRSIELESLAETRFIAIGQQSATSAFVAERLAERGVQLVNAHTVDTEGTAILYVELGLGHVVLPAVQARALAKRAELEALRIHGLPPLPLGWAARDFELLSTTAREFLSLFDRARSKLLSASSS